MSEPVFKVGDKVKFKVFNARQAMGVTDRAHSPGWVDAMTDDACSEMIFKVIAVDDFGWDYPPTWKSWIRIEHITDVGRWLVIAAWIEHVRNDVKPKCDCNISCGCTCGVFAEEQKSKGLVYDKWTKLWVEKPR